jgi:hypothetical protein
VSTVLKRDGLDSHDLLITRKQLLCASGHAD